ncbi:MAG TPA: NADP-dependent oxidoreductase, partial [Armatimonadota bacterium]|nr:NADP-dependent oxidoreductase [Armatimonadota bacterium]
IHEFGGPDVLRIEDVPDPQPAADEIRVRVIAAAVNPVDWKIREGRAGEPQLPMTLGVDFAGVVDMVGDDVRIFHIGDEVFAKASQGGYAEYAVTKAAQAARIPRNIGFPEAASIPTAALAAWQAIFDHAGLQKGQSILIHGAAGGVGSFAVQFAKWKGAYVIGTASGDNVQFARDLGADTVIDYKKDRFESAVHDVDVVLDTIGGDTLERSWSVLKPGGFLVSLVAPITEETGREYGVHAANFMTIADGNELAEIAALIEEGHVKPIVTTVLPLSEVQRAQEMSEAHHTRGKIVLRVAEDPVR